MPYHFPYEDLFAWGIGLLIIALLCLRIVVVRRQRQAEQNRSVTTEK
ncbi:MAG: hypothetical protein NPIRA02_22510 [Nitrospirales bacterium]|nr:MAG: hypothetical protein NPIRA02_22510 [Nitrospirales bacterium]